MSLHTRNLSDPAPPVGLMLQPRAVAVICGSIIAVLSAMHPVAVLADRQGSWRIETFRLMLLRFDLNVEQGVGTWAMAAGLALCGLVMLSIASRARAWRGHWRVLGILFGLLSMDEVASFHELMGVPIRARFDDLPGFLQFAWILPASAAVLVLGLLYLRFVLALPAKTRSRVVIAGVIYLFGVLVLEAVGASVFSNDPNALRYEFIVMAEEMCEMVGIAIMLMALLGFATTGSAPPTSSEARSSPSQ